MVSPSNTQTGGSTNPTYTWGASTGANTYTLQVALDSGFTNIVINKTGIATTSDTPTTTLTNSTVHYWQVIAVNTVGNTTATGAPWSFTTVAAGAPPGAFSLTSPASGAAGVSVNPTYSWSAATGAVTYTLQVALDAGFTTMVINKTGIATTSDTPTTTLAASTTHYWQVFAVNGNGSTLATGAPWSFTTAASSSPPGPFTLGAPADTATGVSLTPTYTWTSSAGAVTYDLEVATDAGFTSIVVSEVGITGTWDTPGTVLISSTLYYWRVTAVNVNGNTVATGAPWSFTTVAGGSPPGAFTLVSPADASSGVSISPTYSWNSAPNSTSYTLQVATDAGMTNLVIDQSGLTATSDTPATVLAEGTMYYWQVIASNATGDTTSTSAPWSFTTATSPLSPGDVEPEGALGCSGRGGAPLGWASLIPLLLLGIFTLFIRVRFSENTR
jgi:uncharacterized protein YmfQ (DUF2313 family)